MPFRALAFALSDDVRVVRQCHMNDSPFLRGHRVERPRPSPRSGARGILGDGVEFLGSPLLVAFDIDYDVGALLELSVDEQSDYELQVSERLAAPANQKTRVFAFYFENDRTVAEFIEDVCFDLHVHSGYKVTKNLAS